MILVDSTFSLLDIFLPISAMFAALFITKDFTSQFFFKVGHDQQRRVISMITMHDS